MAEKYQVPTELLTRAGSVDLKGAARELVAGHLESILANRDAIVRLETADLTRLIDFAKVTRANCGGFGCG